MYTSKNDLAILLSNIPQLIGSANKKYNSELQAAQYVTTQEIRDFYTSVANKWEDFIYLNGFVSEVMRTKGNHMFKEGGNMRKVLNIYTRAIYLAPKETQCLAFAHGNRAAVLHKMGEYEAALYDCECALEQNHPLTSKIVSRKETISRLLEEAAQSKGESTEKDNAQEKRIKIYLGNIGRTFCVAEEDIEGGDVIMTENCFAFSPLWNRYSVLLENISSEDLAFICDNCLEDSIVPFPCYDCRAVSYCSRKCMQAHRQIHRVECIGYKKNIFRDMSELQLALRCLVLISNDLFRKLENLKEGQVWERAGDIWPIVSSAVADTDLFPFFADFDHFQKHRNTLYFMVQSLFLVCFLMQKTDFFAETRGIRAALMQSEDEWQIVFTALLLRLVCVLNVNQHEVGYMSSSCIFDGPTVAAGKLHSTLDFQPLCTAVFRRLVAFEHSCVANTILDLTRTKATLIARHNILQPEQVQIFNYCSMEKSSQNRRWRLYDAYEIFCECSACKNPNDPTYVKLYGIVCNREGCGTTYVPNEHTKCPKCGNIYSPAFYGRLIKDAELMNTSTQKFTFLYRKFQEMDRFLPKYCIRRKMGNMKIIIAYLKVSNEAIKADETLNRQMLEIAIDCLLYVDECEVLYPKACFQAAALMDILALRKQHNMPPAPVNCDLAQIKQSFQKLSTRVKARFEKYYEEYVASNFDLATESAIG